MFAIIFLGIVFYLCRHHLLNSGEIGEVMKVALRQPLGETFLASVPMPSARTELMSRALGEQWNSFDPEYDIGDFVGPSLGMHFERSYFGPMDMDIAGDQVLIYDMLVRDRYRTEAPHVFETVISIKPVELNLPQFILSPKRVLGIPITSVASIKTGTGLDMLFNIETLTPHRVQALFQSQLGRDVLIPFLTEQKWTVEWTGDRLIVYERNRLLEPTQIADVSLEVCEFFDLLKSGPQAVDAVMKELFRSSAVTNS